VIPADETRGRRRCAPATVAALLGAVLATAACGGDGTAPEGREIGEVRSALTAAGLEICDAPESSRATEEAEREQALVVALACGEDDDQAVVELIAWADEEARDAALRRFAVQTRPNTRNHGTTWELGPLTVSVSGERDDAVVDRVADAMDSLGAS
jgi:hypothetical protein